MKDQTELNVNDAGASAHESMVDYRAIAGDIVGDKLTLNMGPSHPATHGVLRLVLELDGEILTKCDPVVGYLHRGDEKIAEAMQYNQFVPYTDRLDYLAPICNNIAYAMAVEKLMGWTLPPRGQALRVLADELSRISSHMLGVGVYAMDVGAMTVFLYTYVEREKVHNFTEQLTGARFTTSWTRVGGQTRDIPEGFLKDVERFCEECSKAIDEVDKLLTKNRIFVDRLVDIGTISKEKALAYGMTGPNLRASGVARDLRKDSPYLGYEQYEFDIPVGTKGDCYDRYLVRRDEMRESIRIVRQVIKNMPGGPINVVDPHNRLPDKKQVLMGMEQLINHFMLTTQGVNAPIGEVYCGHENPKGELGFYICSRGGGVPYRMKIRSPSFTNLSILSDLLPGHMISDVTAILGSLDFVMGECDR